MAWGLFAMGSVFLIDTHIWARWVSGISVLIYPVVSMFAFKFLGDPSTEK